MKTVLLVDNDLGFVFWLGQILDSGGYAALPAKDVPAARSLIQQLRLSVDVLLLNYSLPGATGLVAGLRHAQEQVKVIALIEDGAQSDRLLGADICCPRSERIDESSKSGWLQAVSNVLAGAVR